MGVACCLCKGMMGSGLFLVGLAKIIGEIEREERERERGKIDLVFF